MTGDDWPTHAAELGRKTSETLVRWTTAYDAGRITKREYYILVSGLHDATEGLAPRDLTELMREIHAELRAPKSA